MPGLPHHRRGARPIATLVAVCALVLALVVPGVAAAAPGDGTLALNVTITDTGGNPITVVDASEITDYRVNIAYGCNGAACQDAVVSVAPTPLDPYYGTDRKETSVTYIPPFTPAPPLSGSIAAGYSVALGTVQEGTNGIIRLDYRVGARSSRISAGNFFPDGSPIRPDVSISSSSAASVTDNSASATWKSYIPTPNLTLSTTPPGRVNTDTDLTVSAGSRSACWSSPSGVLRTFPYDLCGDSGQITVQLPARAQYVQGSGGVYDAATHSVTVTSGPKAWQSVEGSFRVTFSSADYPTSGDGCVANETLTAKDASYTYLDGTTKRTDPATAPVTITVGNCAPFAKADLAKSSYISGGQYSSTLWAIPTSESAQYTAYWQVSASNQANVPGVATIVDNDLDQPGLPATRIKVASGGPADLSYTLDDGSAHTATGVTDITAPAGRRFTSLTATSSALPGPNVKDTGTAKSPFTLQIIVTVQAGATPGQRTNDATATMAYPENPELGIITPTGSPASRTVEMYNPMYTLTAGNPTATATGGGTVLVGGEATWTGAGQGTNVSADSGWRPQYVFLAPLGWNVKPGGASLATPVPGATFSYRTVTYDGDEYQAVVVNWPAPITGTGTVTLPAVSVRTAPTGAATAGTNNQIAYLFVGDADNAIAVTTGGRESSIPRISTATV